MLSKLGRATESVQSIWRSLLFRTKTDLEVLKEKHRFIREDKPANAKWTWEDELAFVHFYPVVCVLRLCWRLFVINESYCRASCLSICSCCRANGLGLSQDLVLIYHSYAREKWYSKLFREFAVIDLKHYKSGDVHSYPIPSQS